MKFKQKVWLDVGLILGGIAIASGALYYFSNSLNAQASAVVTDKTLLSGQENAVGELATLENEEPQAVLYSTAMDKLMPDQYGLINFGPWLDQIAEKYRVTVTYTFGQNPTPSTPSSPGTMSFSLTAQGPSGSIASFLKDIESESSGFLFTITSFDFTTDSSGENLNAQGTLFFK